MSKKVKLTPELLQKIIAEEKEKLIDLGLLKDDRLESYYKKVSLQEAKLRKKLREVKNLRVKIKRVENQSSNNKSPVKEAFILFLVTL